MSEKKENYIKDANRFLSDINDDVEKLKVVEKEEEDMEENEDDDKK